MQHPANRRFFYRNVRAGGLLDIVLISAVSSLLLTRYFLHLTGYPQIGGDGLHIGHMLFGGVFMLVSISLSLSFLGIRIQRLSALLGGIGFGIFIDEIGKFITSDNNYFFRPTIGIIYAIFIIVYLAFNYLSRRSRLGAREYQLNAMAALEEAVLQDMDAVEKQRAHSLLAQADPNSLITRHLRALLNAVDPVPESQPAALRRLVNGVDAQYVRIWSRRKTGGLVQTFFIIETGLFLVAVIAINISNFDDVTALFKGTLTYGTGLLIGQAISSLVAAYFAVNGALRITVSRLTAFEYFRFATLINLFLTEFFLFSRIQFAALPSFVFNLLVLLGIGYIMHQERRSKANK